MANKRKKPNILQMEQYLKCGYQLIPLYPYYATKMIGNKEREEGKRPRDAKWTTKPYKNKEQIKHAQDGGNVGVRLTSTDLVVDVDPRNFPLNADGDPINSLDALVADLSLSFDGAPTVVTGSGGLHIYLKKPENIAVVDTLEGYDGVEFKTRGRQVVAAGSIHPTTKKHYLWDDFDDDLSSVPQAPEALLRVIKRPDKKHTAIGGGEHNQEEIASMLDKLDPEDYQAHEEWLRLMMACHSASNGDARSEFVEWSTRDPQYQADAWLTGRRWDSLHTDHEGGVGVGTLYKILRDAGEGDAIPRVSAEDDFKNVGDKDLSIPGVTQEDKPAEGEDPHSYQAPSWVKEMNKKFHAVDDNGKFRIMYRSKDAFGRTMWLSSTMVDWENRHRHMKTEDPNTGKVVYVTKAWLEWPGHNNYEGVIFDPEQDHPGMLNLWDGWPIQPKKGDWHYLQELLLEVLCDGNEEAYEYVMNWMAYMVQHPGRPAEVALCFRGDKGVGKSTLGKMLTELCGRHGITVTSPALLTGRFDGHLRDVICLFADEAIKPQDRASEGILKGLITDDKKMYETKGMTPTMDHSRIHLIMASNEDWVVPASLKERRFFVSDVNDKRIQDTVFFGKLYEQMTGDKQMTGLRAMMFDLLTRDIGDWAPRDNIPDTKAMADQKVGNLSPIGQWWAHILEEGTLPFEITKEEEEWDLEPVRAFKADVRDHFTRWCKDTGIRPGGMGRALDRTFTKELKALCPRLTTGLDTVDDLNNPMIKASVDGRAPCFKLPSLSECRKDFTKVTGGWSSWD